MCCKRMVFNGDQSVTIFRKETCIELRTFVVQESSHQITSPEPRPFLYLKTPLSKRGKRFMGTRIQPFLFTGILEGLFYMLSTFYSMPTICSLH